MQERAAIEPRDPIKRCVHHVVNGFPLSLRTMHLFLNGPVIVSARALW